MGLLCNEKVEKLLDSSSNTTDLPKYPSSSTKKADHDDHQILEKDLELLDCPRCGSMSTKFCYYNNYNKSQPRHFCKACKRHWTKGGTLRNVPIGGCRKNKRLKTTGSDKSAVTAPVGPVVSSSSTTSVNLMYHQDCHDLYLGDQGGLKALNEDHQKSISSLLFDSFMDNSDLPLDCGSNQSSISGIQEKHNVYYYDHCYSSQLESLESSSTMTTVTQSNSIFHPPWKSGGTSATELADCWNLNDLDALISADVNVPWDDNAEINP